MQEFKLKKVAARKKKNAKNAKNAVETQAATPLPENEEGTSLDVVIVVILMI